MQYHTEPVKSSVPPHFLFLYVSLRIHLCLQVDLSSSGFACEVLFVFLLIFVHFNILTMSCESKSHIMKLPTMQILRLPLNSFSTRPNTLFGTHFIERSKHLSFLGSIETKFHTHNTTDKFTVSRILFCAPCGRRWSKKKDSEPKGR